MLHWSWLAAPYLLSSAAFVALAVAAAITRGDRVLRLGLVGAAVTALPWSVAQAAVAMLDDPVIATRVLRAGHAPVALIGPSLMHILLAFSGQLERHRWVARIAGLVGAVMVAIAWSTDLVVPGVQRLPSGMFYIAVGPLTGLHIGQLIGWLVVGIAITRRTSTGGERRRTGRLLLLVAACGGFGSLDLLLLYGVWGSYPVAWVPALIAAVVALYLVTRTDLLRSRGIDRGVAYELAAYALAIAAVAFATLTLAVGPFALAALAALIWAITTSVAWWFAPATAYTHVFDRQIEQFTAQVATVDDARDVVARARAFWRDTLHLDTHELWLAEASAYIDVASRARHELAPGVAAWFAEHPEPLAAGDLGTMMLGGLRAPLDALCARDASLVVPLVDRDELIGVVHMTHSRALRDDDRGALQRSAAITARALAFAALAQAAARERETAREVEIAETMRRQATVSGEAAFGRWSVAAEYRGAERTTGAGWSAVALPDGKLALMVTEAQAHGVAAALATAALTGAFAAATSEPVTLDELLRLMRASSDGVVRGGEPVAAFLAILDPDSRAVEWAAAGHPGATTLGPIANVDTGLPVGSKTAARPSATPLGGGERSPGASLSGATRGRAQLPVDSLLVVASSGLRGDDADAWQHQLREVAPASGQLARVLVERARDRGHVESDLLAVVVRSG